MSRELVKTNIGNFLCLDITEYDNYNDTKKVLINNISKSSINYFKFDNQSHKVEEGCGMLFYCIKKNKFNLIKKIQKLLFKIFGYSDFFIPKDLRGSLTKNVKTLDTGDIVIQSKDIKNLLINNVKSVAKNKYMTVITCENKFKIYNIFVHTDNYKIYHILKELS